MRRAVACALLLVACDSEYDERRRFYSNMEKTHEILVEDARTRPLVPGELYIYEQQCAIARREADKVKEARRVADNCARNGETLRAQVKPEDRLNGKTF